MRGESALSSLMKKVMVELRLHENLDASFPL